MTVGELAAMLEPTPWPQEATNLAKLRAVVQSTKSQPLFDHDFLSAQGETYQSKVAHAGVVIDLLEAAEALVKELMPTPPPRPAR